MSLPKYIVNFDELTDALKKDLLELIDNEFKSKHPEFNTNNVEALLEDIKKLMPSVKYEELKKKIEVLVSGNIEGIQKVEGKLLDIPPVIQENKAIFKFDKDVFLTGLHFNQAGWKKEDDYSLEIDRNKIIDNAATKEIGEHKYFNTYFKVNANTPISFILNNKSGNSRQVMVDLEYLEGKAPTEVVDPAVPGTPIQGDENTPIIIPCKSNSKSGINFIGYVEVTEDIKELIIEGNFGNITGFQWPDLNLIYRGEGLEEAFGFNSIYCNSMNPVTQTKLLTATKVEYTGWVSPVEIYKITNPKKGRWYIEGRGVGASADSAVKIKINVPWILTNIQI